METPRKTKQSTWKNIGAALLALLGYFAAQLLFEGAWLFGHVFYLMRRSGSSFDSAVSAALDSILAHQCVVLIVSCMLFLSVAAFIFHKKHSSLSKEIHLSRVRPLLFILFLCLGFATNYVLVFLLNRIPFPESWVSSYAVLTDALVQEVFPLRFVSIAVLGPITEEVVFRGLIFLRFRRIMPKVAAILLESLLFGLFHGHIISILYGTVMGIVLSIIMERTDNLACPIAFHIGFNLIGIF